MLSALSGIGHSLRADSTWNTILSRVDLRIGVRNLYGHVDFPTRVGTTHDWSIANYAKLMLISIRNTNTEISQWKWRLLILRSSKQNLSKVLLSLSADFSKRKIFTSSKLMPLRNSFWEIIYFLVLVRQISSLSSCATSGWSVGNQFTGILSNYCMQHSCACCFTWF